MNGTTVVVIVTYNSARVLRAALDRLTDLTVQIVDNGSTDGTLQIASDYANVQVHVSASNVGYGAAVNTAAGLHPTADICVLNPDVVADSGAIESLARYSTGWPVGLVAPKLLNEDGSLQLSARNHQTLGVVLAARTPLGRTRLGRRLRAWQGAPSSEGPLSEVPWVTGAAMYFHRQAFDAVGGFDDDFFMYQEDQDICVRLRASGWRVLYAPDVVMTHGHARASRQSLRAATRHLVSTLKFFKRHPRLLFRVLHRERLG